jgi:hypothetical protein
LPSALNIDIAQNALGTAAVQNGRLERETLVFDGTVNFGLTRVLVPGPNGFPPTQFAPGAMGESSLLGETDPFNVSQQQPNDPVHYSPIWDVTPVKWTDAAIAAGLRVQFHSQDAVRTQAMAGNIVSALPGTPNAGLGGINAIRAISNCPIIVVFPGGVVFPGTRTHCAIWGF